MKKIKHISFYLLLLGVLFGLSFSLASCQDNLTENPPVENPGDQEKPEDEKPGDTEKPDDNPPVDEEIVVKPSKNIEVSIQLNSINQPGLNENDLSMVK